MAVSVNVIKDAIGVIFKYSLFVVIFEILNFMSVNVHISCL